MKIQFNVLNPFFISLFFFLPQCFKSVDQMGLAWVSALDKKASNITGHKELKKLEKLFCVCLVNQSPPEQSDLIFGLTRFKLYFFTSIFSFFFFISCLKCSLKCLKCSQSGWIKMFSVMPLCVPFKNMFCIGLQKMLCTRPFQFMGKTQSVIQRRIKI
jgi:hypothetical protein